MTGFWTWQHAVIQSDLPAVTRHVLLTIGCHMAMDGSGAFPSYGLLARETGLHRSTVIQHVNGAVERGWLEKEMRSRKDGSSSTNTYKPSYPETLVHARPRSTMLMNQDIKEVVAEDDHHIRGVVVQNDHVVVEDDRGSRLGRPLLTTHLTTQITSPPNPLAGEETPSKFDAWWEAYPRGRGKDGKKVCREVWKAKKLDALSEEVMRGLEGYKDSEKVRDGYVKGPVVFLRQEVWKDYLAEVKVKQEAVQKSAERRRREDDDLLRKREEGERVRAEERETAKAFEAYRATYDDEAWGKVMALVREKYQLPSFMWETLATMKIRTLVKEGHGERLRRAIS